MIESLDSYLLMFLFSSLWVGVNYGTAYFFHYIIGWKFRNVLILILMFDVAQLNVRRAVPLDKIEEIKTAILKDKQ